MKVKLSNGQVIEARKQSQGNGYEIAISVEYGKETVVKLNPDEMKWFALSVHRLSSEAI